MLQREVPEYVNVAAARLAHALGTPVFMDVGGTDAPCAASPPSVRSRLPPPIPRRRVLGVVSV